MLFAFSLCTGGISKDSTCYSCNTPISLSTVYMNITLLVFYVCLIVHHRYNNVDNQLDATITVY